jgi:hypothetical protein
MSDPEFELVELRKLRIHEEVLDSDVDKLVVALEREGELAEPIWVDRSSWVILNGHHRFAAVRRLGASRIPAWLFEYNDPRIRLTRWNEGPPLTKAEVVRRGLEGRPFPPKTTRHQLELQLPVRRTPLAELRDSSARVRPPAAQH